MKLLTEMGMGRSEEGITKMEVERLEKMWVSLYQSQFIFFPKIQPRKSEFFLEILNFIIYKGQYSEFIVLPQYISTIMPRDRE